MNAISLQFFDKSVNCINEAKSSNQNGAASLVSSIIWTWGNLCLHELDFEHILVYFLLVYLLFLESISRRSINASTRRKP